MTELCDIIRPISSEMQQLDKYLADSIAVSTKPMLSIMDYVSRLQGKRLRPALVVLCARLFGDAVPKTYRAAAFVEMVHVASLIHDDVVDESSLRRGKASVNALWDNKSAVLAGDYMLSQAISILVNNNDYDVLETILPTASMMCEGELMQMGKAIDLDISENDYFDIITRKTASFMASCCAAGALSVGADAATQRKLYDYGKCLGIVFQLRDDLFDVLSSDEIGKPVGNDMMQHKLTLPLIHYLEQASATNRAAIIDAVRNGRDAATILEQVRKSDSIAYAESKMKQYGEQALAQLQGFRDSDILQSLKALTSYCAERKR